MILSPEKISNFQLYGYHITETSNLKLIKKEGLVPKCGKRSREIGDYRKVVYFYPALILTDTWREALYKDTNSANLALLRFDLTNVDITITDKDSWDLFGDWYTKEAISPEKIKILKRLDRYGNPFPLEELLQQPKESLIWEPISSIGEKENLVLRKTLI
ncbi:MAG TPA: hypothetical protein IAB56_02880 [Candidatus Scybalousia intestinigallinarum]|mgnify:FL=1|nr:hypothetical protein [Candidatus Scybalousia intestinigallinarum]